MALTMLNVLTYFHHALLAKLHQKYLKDICFKVISTK